MISIHIMRMRRICHRPLEVCLKLLAEDDLAAGRLVVPFDLSLPVESAYYLITLEERAGYPRVETFREWLIEESAKM